jgi:hypothetical protein
MLEIYWNFLFAQRVANEIMNLKDVNESNSKQLFLIKLPKEV